VTFTFGGLLTLGTDGASETTVSSSEDVQDSKKKKTDSVA
jgi:hypothetical protein